MSQVKATWNRVADAKGYRLYRKLDDGTWKRRRVVRQTTNPSFTDTDVRSGQSYSAKVSSYDAAYNESKPTRAKTVQVP